MQRRRIAIVGTGIAGNVAANALFAAGHEITVFEANDHVGGHTHTHAIDIGDEHQRIDTGFIVFNDRTYPNFVRLLDSLGVASQPSSMSFSVRNDRRQLEYNGTSIDGLFAQRRNLLNPGFLRMIAEILRFNRLAPTVLTDDGPEITLRELLERHGFGGRFVDDYLVPMGAAIWSTEPARMFDFPARFFVRFLHNHGMLSVDDRPLWRVIRGGSASYVERLIAPWRERIRLNCPVTRLLRLTDRVLVSTPEGPTETFDHVFIACHADQALRLLGDPSLEEREVLGALTYQTNEAVLHTDTSLLPRSRRAWAAWNYHVLPDTGRPVALTYDMNILQGLRSRHRFCVTLNATERVDPARILRRLSYDHPLFTPRAVVSQARHGEISGVRRTYYCGAYWRYGFHEDGVVSALAALAHFERAIDEQRDLRRVA
ncbi:MAG: FAD-dependent oxidoreductase [Burkholderiaceae bacterium]